LETVLYIIELIGVISFSAAGAMIAIDKETDMLGVLILSLVTCFGGGLTRDVILTDRLPALFSMHVELIICVSTSFLIFLSAAMFKREYVAEEETVNKINNVLDALGIGIFAAAGTGMFVDKGALVAVFAGTVTAVGGGLLRDIMLRDVPFILCKKVYCVAVILGSALYYIFETYVFTGTEGSVASTIICLSVVFIIRMCATRYKWHIPKAIRFSEINCEKREDSEQETVTSAK
jgi:uncharacterized membrane protein YeiH